MNGGEDITVAYEFIGWNDAFRRDLEVTFPDEDILETSAFSGKEILALIGSASEWFINKISEFLLRWKNKPEGQRIRLKMGENEVELSGFNSEDIKGITKEVQALLAELRNK
jgi:hypothetical protein